MAIPDVRASAARPLPPRARTPRGRRSVATRSARRVLGAAVARIRDLRPCRPPPGFCNGAREPHLEVVVHHNLGDVVTARALRHGLATHPRPDVVAELVELARADRHVLALALARVERGLAERWSVVGERARDAIEQALARVPADAASSSAAPLVPMRPLSGPRTAGAAARTSDPGPSALPCA